MAAGVLREMVGERHQVRGEPVLRPDPARLQHPPQPCPVERVPGDGGHPRDRTQPRVVAGEPVPFGRPERVPECGDLAGVVPGRTRQVQTRHRRRVGVPGQGVRGLPQPRDQPAVGVADRHRVARARAGLLVPGPGHHGPGEQGPLHPQHVGQERARPRQPPHARGGVTGAGPRHRPRPTRPPTVERAGDRVQVLRGVGDPATDRRGPPLREVDRGSEHLSPLRRRHGAPPPRRRRPAGPPPGSSPGPVPRSPGRHRAPGGPGSPRTR